MFILAITASQQLSSQLLLLERNPRSSIFRLLSGAYFSPMRKDHQQNQCAPCQRLNGNFDREVREEQPEVKTGSPKGEFKR
jgi:hypothetical protein